MQQQKGFTLIELIIVIVILGILAVAAAPRFIDLSGDARAAAMEGILGAVKSSSQLTHSALLLNPTGNVIAEGVDVQTDAAPLGNFGDPATDVQAVNDYPHAEDICDLIGLTTADAAAGELGADDASDDITCTMTGTNLVTISDTAATTPATCIVTYTEPTGANLPPAIAINTAGC